MKIIHSLIATALATGSIAASFAGDLTGKVTLEGTPPEAKVIDPLMSDRVCGPLHTDGPVKTRFYVVSADKGLGDVFVYVKAGLEGKKFDPTGPEPELNQVGCLYDPYVLGVMAGQAFKVKNSDPFMHNVHALAKNNPEFNFVQLSKGAENEKTFANSEIFVTFKCDVHPWMFAYVGVSDSPYFAVTDKDGNFKISGLPAGKYTLQAYHRKAGRVDKEITVGADAQKVDFTLKVPAQ